MITKHGSFDKGFTANDSHAQIVDKTRAMLKEKKIKSPNLNKMFCVEFNDFAHTKRYTTCPKRYEQLLKMKRDGIKPI